MKMNNSEKKLQRRLTYLGLATLASAPFLGPLMVSDFFGFNREKGMVITFRRRR